MTDQRVPTVTGKATYHVDPDDVDVFKTVNVRLAKAGSQAPGCLFFNAAQDAGDPTTFYLFEGWESFDTILAFHATDAFKEMAREALSLRIDKRYGTVFTVTAVEDMEMPK